MSRFTRVKLGGLSEVRRMPRLGKIRLGHKVQTRSGGMRPAEVDYFIFDDHAHYLKLGFENPEDCKSLEVMLPSESLDKCFPVALKRYTAPGLQCEGDGEEALERQSDGSWTERSCPCPAYEDGDCKEVAVLNVIVPKISVGGIFQIVTSSKTSIIDIQSGIEHIRDEIVGRCKMVPLLLERIPTKISHTDKKTGEQKKTTHYTLRLTFPFDIDFLNRLKDETKRVLAGPQYLLPTTDDLNPYADAPDLIETDDGEVREVHATTVVGDDGQDEPAPKPAKKPAKKAAKKSAKAKPDAKPAPAAATADNGVAMPRVKKFWMGVQSVFGKESGRTFMEFFVKTYCGVASSAELTADVFDCQEDTLTGIMQQPKEEWAALAGEWWNDLQGQAQSANA